MKTIAKDLAAALKNSRLDAFFRKLPPSHRNEYLKWITEAKRPETRRARIDKTVKMLSIKHGAKAPKS